jgi:hypothetical protein
MFFLLPRDRFLNDFRNVFIAGPLAHHISEGDLVWIEEANLMKDKRSAGQRSQEHGPGPYLDLPVRGQA